MRIFKPLLMGVLLTTSTVSIAAREAEPRGEARLAKIVEGKVAGNPVNCIDLHSIDSTEVVDGTAIVYHDGGRIYVNRPDFGRESLDSDDVLLTRTWSTQLCSVDTVRLLDRDSRLERGFVGLGEFVPYTKPKRS